MEHLTRGSRRLSVLVRLCLVLGPALAADAAETPTATGGGTSPPADIELLLSAAEREAYLSLEREHERHAFVERFWQVRDPFPETGRNEFRDSWRQRVSMALERYGGLAGERSQALLFNGPPTFIIDGACPRLLEPMEIWRYGARRDSGAGFSLVFVRRPGGGADPYRLWTSFDGFRSLLAWNGEQALTQYQISARIADSCPRGGEIQAALTEAIDWRHEAERRPLVPVPSDEWVAAFLARLTRLQGDAPTLRADLQLAFPGRHQSRTILQGVLTVPPDEITVSADGTPSYNLLLDGEILLKDRVFDRFRYRFDLPASDSGAADLPLVVERYLRPGDYTLILKLRDLNSDRVYGTERPVEVPRVEVARASPTSGTPPAPAATGPRPGSASADLLLAEANTNLATEDHSLKILPPPDSLLTGRFRVTAQATGADIAKVTFLLNGKRVMSKTRPPYTVELNLGRAPRTHRLQAVALDRDGSEVARDEIPLNFGPHRFGVRLLEPQEGGNYRRSLRARAEVDVPSGQELDRVEIFLNEVPVATLFQPPFVQPIVLPERRQVTYVRALAHLTDGNTAEDLVFINTPENLDEVQVDFVELYTTVTDRRGRIAENLAGPDFTVFEDGAEQDVVRFELVRDLPIHAAILLDTSTSMSDELVEAERAALRFFESVIQPKDRAAVITFNDRPELRVRLTNSLEVLAGGLADLTVEGETALHDSIIYGLYYLAGLRGKKALIVLSDGEDSNSRHTFAEALDFARHSGVAVYSIGLGLDVRDVEARNVLQRMSSVTGGSSYFIDRARQLERIYRAIEAELRSQYLLGYQSTQSGSEEFREVAVQLTDTDLEAKTIPGYYP